MRAFWISLLCLLVLPFTVLAQSDDRDVLTAFIEDNLSGAGRKVTVTGFSGAFSSRAEIETLTIADETGVWLTLNKVVLDWSRASLLVGVVDVTELVADEIIVARKPIAPANAVPTPEAQGFSLPELPVSISIKQLEAKRIVLGETVIGQPIQGSLTASANLNGGEGSVDLDILRDDAGPDGRVTLKATYANANRELTLDLSAAEGADGIAANLLDLPGRPSVDLTVAGSGPLDDFAATLDLRTDGADRLQGMLTLQGETDGAQRLSVDISGDVAPLFLPDYAAFFGPEIAVTAAALRQPSGQLDLTALSIQARALQLQGSAIIATDGLPQRLALTGTLGLPDGSPVLLPLGGDMETRVVGADISLGFDATTGDGWKTALSLRGLSRADVTLDRATLKGSGRINRRAGAGGTVVGGTLNFAATDVDLTDAALAQALGRDLTGRLVFDWQQGGLGLRIGRLELVEDGYTIAASARFDDFESRFRTRGSVDAQYRDLGRLTALAGRPLSGEAAFRLSGQVIPLGGQFDVTGSVAGTNITLDVAEVDNLLRGGSTISFAAARSKQGTFLRQLDVTAQALTASASGKLASDGSDITAKLRFDDLAVLGGPYRGALSADASFSGTPALGRLTLDGIGTNLKIGQAQADALTTGDSRLALVVGLRDGRLDLETATLSNPQISADAKGFYDAAGSDITAQISLPNLAPLGPGYRGGLKAVATAKGTLDAGRVDVTGTGSSLAIGNAQADSLLRGQTTLTAGATFQNRRIQIERATLSNLQLQASATGSVTDALREVKLEARLANLALLVPDFAGAVTVSGRASENGNGVTLDLQSTGPGGIDARVAGRLAPGFRNADLTITGSAQAALANAFLGARSVSGQTQFDLALNGPLALSSLSGTARLSGGRFSAPNLPFNLENLTATATLGGNAVQVNVAANPNMGGNLSVTGGVGLSAPNTANLQVALRDMILKDPDLYQIQLSGDLTVTGPLAGGRQTGGAMIGGQISVREAEFRVPTSGFSAIGSLPGLKHKNETAATRQTRYKAGLIDLGAGGASPQSRPFGLNVTIDAPSRLFIRGRGIDAEMGGRVALRGDTNAVVPSGSFDLIRGRLDILGKRMVLDQGQLLLQGDLIPTIDITASNDADGVTTRVMIKGPADDPEITFGSTPELPQEEVLARLLFGKGIQTISALQAAQLANAVATLAGRGGEGIVSKLRKNFGLDDFDVTTDADGNVSVRAGKYISKRVYTEVEVDQKGRSQINLNLDLKKDVTVRGSVGADGQAGIGVFIEKDY
ncbi:autotransporter secretion inner membrane protein TamB [Pseudorhodobacter antarcticus]|uniref:Autotransporter secretion inner membrane protein TamB n=1 Tax=Pseudorhodobacter antarcticus TaxID=1077947 RepID=A0A1H8E9R1_9RHOB|nr:translocation/assembly module TamB domain-containing protein [Pseudorhodobacter antarcticus]SEN15508.1 autotransporter secretion inner membrane protein TamB [Pseudorhodobacter antarcticus]